MTKLHENERVEMAINGNGMGHLGTIVGFEKKMFGLQSDCSADYNVWPVVAWDRKPETGFRCNPDILISAA